MDLKQKIKFVNDLIRENPEITLAEYLASVQEVETIEKTQTDMGNRKGIPNLTDEQKLLVLAHAPYQSAKDVADHLELSLNQVYKVCVRAGASIREIRHPEVAKAEGLAPVEPVKHLQRPVAEYSNQGFLSTIQKYAV